MRRWVLGVWTGTERGHSLGALEPWSQRRRGRESWRNSGQNIFEHDDDWTNTHLRGPAHDPRELGPDGQGMGYRSRNEEPAPVAWAQSCIRTQQDPSSWKPSFPTQQGDTDHNKNAWAVTLWPRT